MYYLLIILIYNYTTECINEIIYYSEVVILLSLSNHFYLFYYTRVSYTIYSISFFQRIKQVLSN